jgi:hypothetical protein
MFALADRGDHHHAWAGIGVAGAGRGGLRAEEFEEDEYGRRSEKAEEYGSRSFHGSPVLYGFLKVA